MTIIGYNKTQQNITIYKDGDSASITMTVPKDGAGIYKVYDIVDGIVSHEPALYGDVYFSVHDQPTIELTSTGTIDTFTSKSLTNTGMYHKG